MGTCAGTSRGGPMKEAAKPLRLALRDLQKEQSVP